MHTANAGVVFFLKERKIIQTQKFETILPNSTRSNVIIRDISQKPNIITMQCAQTFKQRELNDAQTCMDIIHI